MHIPKYFEESDPDRLERYIRDYSFGLLIVAHEGDIEATHLPFHVACRRSDEPLLLQCHVARKNPVWRYLEPGRRVLAVFQGPDAYISPSWYPTKQDHGRVVPTWNYVAVHAEGEARTVDDPAWLSRHMRHLTDQHESGMSEPWAVDDAPAEFTNRLMRAVVGIEIEVDKLRGKLKASQNQPEQNRAGVRAGLAEREDSNSRAMSRFVD